MEAVVAQVGQRVAGGRSRPLLHLSSLFGVPSGDENYGKFKTWHYGCLNCSEMFADLKNVLIGHNHTSAATGGD